MQKRKGRRVEKRLNKERLIMINLEYKGPSGSLNAAPDLQTAVVSGAEPGPHRSNYV